MMEHVTKLPISEKFFGLWQMIGNTAMVRIGYRFRKGREYFIYAKCEHSNMTGSIKDRMALYILQQASLEKKIKPGDTIVEATSGNTGIVFAAIGKALGYKVKILMPDWLSVERRQLIKSYGAEINLVSKEQGGFLGSIRLAQIASKEGNVFLPLQFENRFNTEAHEKTTGPEIGYDLMSLRLKPDAFVAGVGTGGTVMGVGNYLRTLNPNIRVHPLEPAESPTLSTGFKTGSHRIQGISDEFIPVIVKLDRLDKVVRAADGHSILMAQRLAAELGLAVGISSGANLLGAIQVQQEMGPDAVVVTVFPDNNKKYLSTDLMREEPLKPGYLSTDIVLTGFSPLYRK
jgi:cysteine synthase A